MAGRRAESRIHHLPEFAGSVSPLPPASDVDIDELHNAFSELHNAPSIVRQVGPDEVSRIAFSIMRVCQLIEIRVRNESRNGSPLSYEERAEIWRTQVATSRDELDEAIQRVSAALWE
ncbi:hypothetical protein [Streptomyces sp. FBKL.4005]|uniref:hypothetical protein n=1 Tax=Streptomyces sp. FBKL.4005 TaxID=2015515 RepID=UPI001180A927|nr:hypothetical protein [Streptomyces sp. FBKL.4005]